MKRLLLPLYLAVIFAGCDARGQRDTAAERKTGTPTASSPSPGDPIPSGSPETAKSRETGNQAADTAELKSKPRDAVERAVAESATPVSTTASTPTPTPPVTVTSGATLVSTPVVAETVPTGSSDKVGSPTDKREAPKATVPVTSETPVASASTNAVLIRLPAGPALPPTASEVVRLAQGGIAEEVLVTFVQSSKETFSLNADQILHLRDLGVTMPVIQALLAKGTALPPLPEPAPALAAAMVPPATQPVSNTLAVATPTVQTGALTTYQAVPDAPQVGAAPVIGQAPAPGTGVSQQVIAQPTAAVNYDYFYTALSPYGSWLQVDNYGWCWQPTVGVTQAGWQPYCQGGRWIWSNHGWYWNSEYAWGWGPFHYGRWHRNNRFGWVWAPGTVWGPAWVSWRRGTDFCGWAPLPPEAVWSPGVGFMWGGSAISVGFGFGLLDSHFAFCGFDRFYDPRPWAYCYPRNRVRDCFNNSTVINNGTIINVSGRNNTVIVNNGIDHETIQKRTRGEVRRVELTDSSTPREGTRLAAVSPNLDRLPVYRPNLPPPSARPPESILARQEARRTSGPTRGDYEAIPGRGGHAIAIPTGGTAFPRATPSPSPSPISGSSGIGTGRPAPAGEGTIGTRPTAGEVSRPSIPAPSTGGSRPRPGVTPLPGERQVRQAPSSVDYPGSRPAPPRVEYRGYEPAAPRTQPSRTEPARPQPAPELQRGPEPVRSYTPSTPSRGDASPQVQPFAPAARPIPSSRAEPARPAPAPAYRSEPARSYSPAPMAPAPAYRAEPRSAPSYSPPMRTPEVSRPAPSYSAPAPSYRAPAPSAPRSSDSGGRPGGGGGGARSSGNRNEQ